jgi:hypothetical protein
MFICLRPPPLPQDLFGVEINFVGSESGQINTQCKTPVDALHTTLSSLLVHTGKGRGAEEVNQ